jgi:integrase
MPALYLVQRGRRFHLRLRIPPDLFQFFGRRELHRSLRVNDRQTARVMARTLQSRAEETFATIRHRRAIGDNPSSLLELARGLYAERLPFTRGTVIQRNAYGAAERSNAPEALSEAVAAYLVDRGTSWEPKTLLMFSATLRLLVDIVGDKPVLAVTRHDCRRFRDTMAQLPPNMTKRFRGCTVAEVMAKGAPPMSAKTVNKNLSALTGLFAWCEREGLIEASPARGLLLHRGGRADLERDAFGPDELRLIFSALVPTMGARYWLPLIALYSGMRLEEIAQLAVSDIRTVQGVPVFDVNADGSKRLKTASSARLVPIHPELIERGLLKLQTALQQRGEQRMWSELTRGADGFYSSPFSKWFGRFKRDIGVTARTITFHSFRHTFVNALKQQGVDELAIKELVGHVNTSITTGRYGKKATPPQLLDVIKLIRHNI